MTRKLFAFEGTDGTTASSAAIGASQQASGAWTFNSTQARYEGSTGLRCVTTAAATTIMRFPANAENAAISTGLAVRLDALPPKTFSVMQAIRSTGSGTALRVIWKADGTVGVRGTGTTTPEILSDNPLTIGKQYWVTVVLSIMGGAMIRFYDAATRVLVATINAAGMMFGFGSTNFNAVDLGFVNGDPVVGQSVNFDSLIINDGATVQQYPDSWSTTSPLAGTMYDGSAMQAGTFRMYDGSALQELASVVIV